MHIQLSYFLVIGLTVLVGCQPNIPEPPIAQRLDRVPKNFPNPAYNFGDYPFDARKFELGRKLFYDPLLSADNSISCATCHQQYAAFADPAHDIPHGIDGKFGTRNSPPIFNLRWMPNFMWDGGINHIEVMPLAPITSEFEMGESIVNVVNKLNNNDTYLADFQSAFGVDTISSKEMLIAFAQFMSGIVSDQSKYDKYLRNEATLSAEELSGKAVFEANCTSCHSGVLFTDFSYQNNGLDSTFTDKGRALITNQTSDAGKFKVPSLRNVAITPPYMHDGRFATLEEVIEHYRNNITASPTLSAELTNGIRITYEEAQQLIAFLNALTDYELAKNPAYSNPFIQP